MAKKKVTVPEEDSLYDVLVNADVWENNASKKPGKWKNYDLFRNNWEHNVIIEVDGIRKPMQEWLMNEDTEIIDEIFKHYKLKIVDEDLPKFAEGLAEVIKNKSQRVGAKIAENSIRCIP